ncbi:MAG: MBL fold metallo-hydrolase [Deltaproteobacteria bacterium]|nr:MBL fold metallo-hydrolase [Deltaproteobacteria bacterium]
MSRTTLTLKEVDKVEIVILMDNYVDVLLASNDTVTRPPLSEGDEIPLDTFVAEHGLSLLVDVYRDNIKHSVLFDTGYTRHGVLHNAERLRIDLGEIEAIVMSHAHMDHTGALIPILDRISRPIDLFLHPAAFHFPRYKALKDGRMLRFPRTLVREELEKRNTDLHETENPTLIGDETVLITGGIARRTDFEKGLLNAYVEKAGKLEKDVIAEDQALAIRLKEKGLVILSGCSHAGIINTVLHAMEATGVKDIYGIMGGFHLSGPDYEPIIDRTIEELARFEPRVLVPMHCTGWEAINRLSEAFPDAFILNSVGSKYSLA